MLGAEGAVAVARVLLWNSTDSSYSFVGMWPRVLKAETVLSGLNFRGIDAIIGN